MNKSELSLLDGVNAEYIFGRLKNAGGKEIESGKFSNNESSAALAANAFGWFHNRAELFPPLPGLEISTKILSINVEYQARFPWRGGRHPWLDAAIETETQIIGIESKRFEPFRDTISVNLSDAYWRDVWGHNMRGFQSIRDKLKTRELKFQFLDAAQLLKHSFGLFSEGRRKNKSPSLYYIFAEPSQLKGKPIASSSFHTHREEAKFFKKLVAGDEVSFNFCSYRDWLSTFDEQTKMHAKRILNAFKP